MKKPSRFMPQYVRPRTRPLAWAFLFVLGAGLLYLACSHPVPMLLTAIGLSIFVAIERHRSLAKLRALSDSRRGESICNFARQFDRHVVDPWIIRAVYEQLQNYISLEHKIPVRASDTFDALSINDEDLDMDLVLEISQRTGRSLEHLNRNPYYGKVRTVADLVFCFNAQPTIT
ncbi:MAG: hypothetical protein PHU14_03855 [Methylovulum sp.]|nr:hypothetical protein [Methylovulum sp.]